MGSIFIASLPWEFSEKSSSHRMWNCWPGKCDLECNFQMTEKIICRIQSRASALSLYPISLTSDSFYYTISFDILDINFLVIWNSNNLYEKWAWRVLKSTCVFQSLATKDLETELPRTELSRYMLETGKISEPLETTSTIHFKSRSKQNNKAMFRNTALWWKRLWMASTVLCQLQGST